MINILKRLTFIPVWFLICFPILVLSAIINIPYWILSGKNIFGLFFIVMDWYLNTFSTNDILE